MKKNILTAIVLMCICVVCAAAISGINTLTEPIIEQNQIAKEADLCKKIFSDYDKASKIITEGFDNESITKLVIAANADNEEIGYIYTVSGKNTYGGITLLVGINNEMELVGVKFMENGQSFSSETVTHVDSNYIGGLEMTDIEGIDTACGATYAAKLVKELVSQAFDDANSRKVA